VKLMRSPVTVALLALLILVVIAWLVTM